MASRLERAGLTRRTGEPNTGGAQRQLLRLAPSLRVHLIGAVTAGVGAAALLVAQMLLLSWVVRDVLFWRDGLGRIAPLLALATAAIAGRACLVALRELVSRRAAIGVKRELREQLAVHLLRLGPAYAGGERTGDLVATATEGVEKLDAYVSRYLPQTALSVAVPLVIVLAILPVDPLSAGLLVFTVPVIVMLMVLIGTFTRDHVQRQWEALSRLSSAFLDVIQGLPTVLLLDRDGGERRRVEALSGQYRDRALRVLKVAFIPGAVLEVMTAAGIGLTATVLGVRLLDGGIAFDRAFFIFLLTPEFYRPLRELGAHRHAAIEGSVAAERILAILQTPAVGAGGHAGEGAGGHWGEGAGGHSGPPLRRRIGGADRAGPLAVEVEDVSYVYPERQQPALAHVTVSLPAGSCTALIGRSGAGKTTLVNLLLRAMDPTGGTIRVNGVPLPALPTEVWREQIALVPQNPHLFRGTVRDNIRLARPEAGDAAVRQAAELAGCGRFIAELPRGFDTVLGEEGRGLSAGQRQRLAIARAFLKDAPLLVLDEPTSALDPESEAHLRQALALLRHERTVLVVAHRRQTIRAASRVILLDGGRLAAAGAPDELLRHGGLSAALLGGGRVEAAAG